MIDDLKHTLELLIEQFVRLKTILGDESDALERRDPDALLTAAGDKHGCAVQIGQLEAQLSHALNGTSLREMLKRASPADRERYEPLHTSLTTLAWECRHYNAVNGKVIHRSRQSVAELARILSGSDGDSIYTARGTTRSAGSFGDGAPITLA